MAASKKQKDETLAKAKKLSAEDVLAELKARGVTDLESLVKARLGEVDTLGVEERGSILIYKCFVVADWD